MRKGLYRLRKLRTLPHQLWLWWEKMMTNEAQPTVDLDFDHGRFVVDGEEVTIDHPKVQSAMRGATYIPGKGLLVMDNSYKSKVDAAKTTSHTKQVVSQPTKQSRVKAKVDPSSPSGIREDKS